MHHESTQLHTAQLVQQSLAKHHIPKAYLPPYSPEMAQCDFILFALIKRTLRGKLFEDVETNEQLLEIPTTEYERCFWQWKSCWNKCVQAEGACFKGDQSVIRIDLILLMPQHQSGYFLIRPYVYGM